MQNVCCAILLCILPAVSGTGTIQFTAGAEFALTSTTSTRGQCSTSSGALPVVAGGSSANIRLSRAFLEMQPSNPVTLSLRYSTRYFSWHLPQLNHDTGNTHTLLHETRRDEIEISTAFNPGRWRFGATLRRVRIRQQSNALSMHQSGFLAGFLCGFGITDTSSLELRFGVPHNNDALPVERCSVTWEFRPIPAFMFSLQLFSGTSRLFPATLSRSKPVYGMRVTSSHLAEPISASYGMYLFSPDTDHNIRYEVFLRIKGRRAPWSLSCEISFSPLTCSMSDEYSNTGYIIHHHRWSMRGGLSYAY